MPAVLEFVEIDSWPLALMVAVVPAERMPADAAPAIAVERDEMFSPGITVKANVFPVAASLTVVTDPAVKGKVAVNGNRTVPCVDVKFVEAGANGGVLLDNPPKTYAP